MTQEFSNIEENLLTLNGLDRFFDNDLKTRLHLVYCKNEIDTLTFKVDNNSVKITYSIKRLGWANSIEEFYIRGSNAVRSFKVARRNALLNHIIGDSIQK